MQWQWLDILILTIIGLSALTGLFRGVVKEVVALVIWLVAIWSGYHYSHLLDPFLKQHIQDHSARTAVAFGAILLGVLFAGGIINTLLSFMLKRTGLSGMDKILGMGFGFVRGVFVMALILAAVKMTSLPYQQHLKDSRLYAQLEPSVNWIYSYFPTVINKIKSVDAVNHIIDTVPQA